MALKTGRTRTTILLTPLLDRNLEVFCFKTKRQKSEVMEEALRLYLTQQGVDLTKEVSIEWL